MVRKLIAGLLAGAWLGLGEDAEVESEKMVILTDESFRKEVDSLSKPMFVKFYAPWCGHCKRMAPDWTKLAEEVSGEEVVIAKCDLTVHNAVAEDMKIRGFPTLRVFAEGGTYEYQGARSLETLKEFALGGWKKGTKAALPWNETFIDKGQQLVTEYLLKMKQVMNYEPTLLPGVYAMGIMSVILFRAIFFKSKAAPKLEAAVQKKAEKTE